ncbi:uncharacterized protein LOC113210805 isoform X2 [Frankliniella occidentalis]|uniref:Uncharacterized protein LOC113210805 isoform X2 n=1 Tax=Frankliniella occidentalis TaxID=133901 RepID=A0A9C6WYF8_FRAOC|nr:uncharacterized protein LOC113210805 isoform X2 [Frankliniella occidentalis]
MNLSGDPDRHVHRRQRSGVRGHLHGSRAAQYRQPVPGLARHRRPVRRRARHVVRRLQRPARVLDVRAAALRHVDRLRRHVLHGLHPQPVRHQPGPLYPHQGPAQVRAVGDEAHRHGLHRLRVDHGGAHLVPAHQPGRAPARRAAARGGRQAHLRRRVCADLRCRVVMHQFLRALRGDAGHLLPPVLLRAEARQEHPRGDAAAGGAGGQQQGGRAGAATAPARALVALPRLGPQGRHHGGRHHGRVPRLLGALLRHQHRGRLLQGLHTLVGLQGSHVARLLQLRLQPRYLLHLQQGVPVRVPPHPDGPVRRLRERVDARRRLPGPQAAHAFQDGVVRVHPVQQQALVRRGHAAPGLGGRPVRQQAQRLVYAPPRLHAQYPSCFAERDVKCACSPPCPCCRSSLGSIRQTRVNSSEKLDGEEVSAI